MRISAEAIAEAVHAERAVEAILPMVVFIEPHRDRLGPTVGVELNINSIAGGRCVAGDCDFKKNRRRGPCDRDNKKAHELVGFTCVLLV